MNRNCFLKLLIDVCDHVCNKKTTLLKSFLGFIWEWMLTYVGEAVRAAPAPGHPPWWGSPPYQAELFLHEDLPQKPPPPPNIRHLSPCLPVSHLPCLLLPPPHRTAPCWPLHLFLPPLWTSAVPQSSGGHCTMPAVAALLLLCIAKGLEWENALTERAL